MKPKRLISLLLAVCMAIAMLPVSAFAADADDTFEYEYKGQKLKYKITSVTDKTVEVSDDLNVAGSVEIPESVMDESNNVYTVTAIGYKAFFGNNNLRHIELPATLKEIKEGGLQWCRNLKGTVIPEGVTTIGKRAFCYVGNRENFTDYLIPASVTTIGDYAFQNNYTKKITFAKGSKVTVLSEGIFAGDQYIEEITLPENLTEIEAGAFHYLLRIKTIKIPERVTKIEDHAFDGCSALETVYYEGNDRTLFDNVAAIDKTKTDIKYHCNVTFKMNGHGTAPADQTVWSGDKLAKVADPTAAGYTFTGWYTDEALTQKFDVENDVISDDTIDTTLYAGWKPIPDHELTVKGGTFTFDDNDAADKGSVYEGAVVTVTLDENDPLWKDGGLSFDHWDIQSKATLLDENGEEIVNPGKTFTFVMPEEGVTVEAVPKTAPAEDDRWDAATVVTGVVLGTGTAILAYHIGTEVYAEQVLGKDVAVPKTREDVALKAWELAGKPAVELNGEPLSEAAQAEKWVVESGLMQNDAEGSFNGAKKMNKLKALRVLDAAKKLG